MQLLVSYKQTFQQLKQNKPVIVNPFSAEELFKANRIVKAGLARYTTVENGLHGLLPIKSTSTPTSHTEPKPTQKQASDLIHVSHWRNGERKDKPAGQAYKVISRHTRFDTEWVTYDMGLGKHHTVKSEYTKAVA